MWPSLNLMPVPPRWQLSCPAGKTVPPHSRMARRHPGAGVHWTGAAPAAPAVEGSFLLRSGPVSSAQLLKTQRRSIRTDRRRIKTGRQPDKTRKRLGRRRSKRASEAAEPVRDRHQSVANRLRADPLLLSNLPENVYLQHVFVEPPRGFEPRTYALRAVRTPPEDRLLLVHSPAYPGIFGHACALFRGITGAFRDAHR